MSRQTRTRAFSAVALGVAAVVALSAMFAAGPAGAAETADPRLALAQANVQAYCTDLVDDATTTRQRNTRADLCTMWKRELADLTPTTTSTPTVAPTTTAPPTTTPAPTTTSPTPSPTNSPSGRPDASTTGVPAGTVLAVHSGDLTISLPGAVVEGLDVRGCVTVAAAGVIFRNSRVTCTGERWAVTAQKSNVLLENLDISCGNSAGKALVGRGLTLRTSDLSGCEDGPYVDGPFVLIERNYIHGLFEKVTGNPDDPYGHTDGIQVADGVDDVTIVGNNVVNDTPHATSAYIGDTAGLDRIRIEGNLLDGGGYTVRCSTSGVDNTLIGNTITRGWYSYWTNCDRSGIVRTGNTLI